MEINDIKNELNTSCINDFKNEIFKLNSISFKESNVQMCLQSENGPCPLIAILNVLLLQGKIKIEMDREFLTGNEMVYLVANYLMNSDKEVYDLDVILQHFDELQTGLMVDVCFSNVTDFKDDQNLYIFKCLKIKLYHGWLMDPQNTPEYDKYKIYSYDQLTAELVKDTDDILCPNTKIFLKEFVHSSQLTYHGLCQLNETMLDGELAVLFQNNHFSVIYKNGQVYSLCSDIGYCGAPGTVWQLLNDTSGDTELVNDRFEPQNGLNNNTFTVESDFEMAQRLMIKDDYEWAKALQEEEESDSLNNSAQSTPKASAVIPNPHRAKRPHIPTTEAKKDSSCTLI